MMAPSHSTSNYACLTRMGIPTQRYARRQGNHSTQVLAAAHRAPPVPTHHAPSAGTTPPPCLSATPSASRPLY
ncbi:hypothetical protein C8T65DRAFT_649002 [Cerioporus squamosus]|nr:hypothetical protein C8T65DRAFT_649002 [Cerioporus squamosus]